MTSLNKGQSHRVKLIFCCTMTLLFAMALLCLMESYSVASPNPRGSSHIVYIDPNIPKVTLPSYGGVRYKATVPDTIDLAEMARLSVNGLTSCTDPDADYEMYFLIRIYGNRPVMEHDVNHATQLGLHAVLPSMRTMSGSMQNIEVEKRWMEVIIQQQGPDGLLYYPTRGRPWADFTGASTPSKKHTGQFDEFEGDQYTGPMNNGASLGILSYYYKGTGDTLYKDIGRRLVDGLCRQATRRNGVAFFPKGLYGLGEISDPNAPDPPATKTAILGCVIGGLRAYYGAAGYEPAKTLADEIAKFQRDHSSLLDTDGRWIGYNRHAGWNGAALMSVLSTALSSGDQEQIEWCRKSFEHAKRDSYGEMLTGWFPEYHQPTGMTGEACAVAYMINLALKLSASGVADYWDDVDRWTRNHFTECQLADYKWMYSKWADQPKLPIDPVSATDDRVGERNLGNFASWPAFNDYFGRYTETDNQIYMHCCVVAGASELRHIYENILHYKNGRLKVNLLMNRASHWADIDSYIPYEGRADVKMKTKADLSIRIPEWVKPSEAKCAVNGIDRKLTFEGRYAQVGKVEAKDVVTLTFPIFIRTNKVTVQGKEYILTRKGNEVIHIEPEGKYCPFYQRDKYRENKAQFKTVERFVAD